MPKKGGSTFGYVEQFNYPLSPCYKNQAKVGWHSGGNSSCSKRTVESEMDGGSGYFSWLLGSSEEKKKKTSTTAEKKKKKTTSTTTEKKKKKTTSSTTEKKKKTSKK